MNLPSPQQVLAQLRAWRAFIIGAAVIFLLGLVAGYALFRPNGKDRDAAIARADSAAAAAKRDAVAYQHQNDSLKAAIALAQQHQGQAQGRTNTAAAGVEQALADAQTALGKITAASHADSVALASALGALARAGDASRDLRRTLADERQTGAQLVATLAADTAAKARRIVKLESDLADSQRREMENARKIGGGWSLGISVGPGVTYDARAAGIPARFTPIQATIGLSHPIELPHILPHL